MDRFEWSVAAPPSGKERVRQWAAGLADFFVQPELTAEERAAELREVYMRNGYSSFWAGETALQQARQAAKEKHTAWPLRIRKTRVAVTAAMAGVAVAVAPSMHTKAAQPEHAPVVTAETHATPSPAESMATMTEADMELLRQTSAALIQLWITAGVDIRDTKLAFLSGNTVHDCGKENDPDIITANGSSSYCSFGEPGNTVIVTAANFNAWRDGLQNSRPAAAWFILSHEMGHRVQDARNEQTPLTSTVAVEREATCYAGNALAVLADPTEIETIKQGLLGPGDPLHGSGEKQVEALTFGLSGGWCTTEMFEDPPVIPLITPASAGSWPCVETGEYCPKFQVATPDGRVYPNKYGEQ